MSASNKFVYEKYSWSLVYVNTACICVFFFYFFSFTIFFSLLSFRRKRILFVCVCVRERGFTSRRRSGETQEERRVLVKFPEVRVRSFSLTLTFFIILFYSYICPLYPLASLSGFFFSLTLYLFNIICD